MIYRDGIAEFHFFLQDSKLTVINSLNCAIKLRSVHNSSLISLLFASTISSFANCLLEYPQCNDFSERVGKSENVVRVTRHPQETRKSSKERKDSIKVSHDKIPSDFVKFPGTIRGRGEKRVGSCLFTKKRRKKEKTSKQSVAKCPEVLWGLEKFVRYLSIGSSHDKWRTFSYQCPAQWRSAVTALTWSWIFREESASRAPYHAFSSTARAGHPPAFPKSEGISSTSARAHLYETEPLLEYPRSIKIAPCLAL